MGTRVTDISHRRWTVWVNAEEVHPEYATEAKAISRGRQEARTHHHVQVTVSVGGRRPRTVAVWEDGERTQ